MLHGSTLRNTIIIILIITMTALLSVAVSFQDYFLAFVALLICIALVSALFRAKPDDSAEEQPRR